VIQAVGVGTARKDSVPKLRLLDGRLDASKPEAMLNTESCFDHNDKRNSVVRNPCKCNVIDYLDFNRLSVAVALLR
jgi:hypothetical protein